MNGRVAGEKLSHSFPVRVVAVVELERCLEASFSSLPHTHGSVPLVIDALCTVVNEFAETSFDGSADKFSNVPSMTVLAIAAFDPLTRLRVAIDRHVAFRARTSNVEETQDIVYSFYLAASEEYRSAVVETNGTPCLEVDGEARQRGASTTSISFDGIATAVLKYLQTSSSFRGQSFSVLSFTRKCMRIHCFDVLRHLFLASIPIRIPVAVARVVFTSDETSEEVSARGLAIVQCAANTVILARRTPPHEVLASEDVDSLHFMVELILTLYESHLEEEQEIGCRAIASMLPSLAFLDENYGTTTIDRVLASLQRRTEAYLQLTTPSKSDGRLFLSVVLDILLVKPICNMGKGLVLKIFQISIDFAIEKYDVKDNYCIQLAMRCIAGLLDRMGAKELQRAKQITSERTRSPTQQAIARLVELMESQTAPAAEVPCTGSVSGFQSKNQMALMDSYNIENFDSEDSRTWLFDNSILITCNIGAKDTRFRGYIEVITRSLAERRRFLIRIPGEISLEYPDFPRPTKASHKRPASPSKATRTPSQKAPESSVKIADVLAQFDLLMSQSDEQGQHLTGGGIPLPPRQEHAIQDPLPGERGVLSWLKTVLDLRREAATVVTSELSKFLSSCGVTRAGYNVIHGEEVKSLIPLEDGEKLDRAIAILDRTPSLCTHKIALLYDKSAEPCNDDIDSETHLLAITRCSPSFHRFASSLGEVVPLWTLSSYSGGLDTSAYESDGKYALAWCDDNTRSSAAATSVVYHVVSFMPNEALIRKRHVGNDYVLVLFADRGSDAIVEFDFLGKDLIGGSFGFLMIWVTVPGPGIYRVNVRVKKKGLSGNLKAILETFACDYTVPEEDAPVFVRNLAMRADLACRAGIGAADAPSNYLYRFELLQAMSRLKQDPP